MFSKVHILITLIAAVAMSVFCIVTYTPLELMCIRLIITILVFYIIGSMAQFILVKQNNRKEQLKEQILAVEPNENEGNIKFDDLDDEDDE